MPGKRSTAEKTFALLLVAGLLFGVYFFLDASNPGVSENEDRDRSNAEQSVTSSDEENGSSSDFSAKNPYENDVSQVDERELNEEIIEKVFPNYLSPEKPWFDEVGEREGYDYVGSEGEYIEGEAVAGVFVSDITNNYRDDILSIGGKEPVVFENTPDGFVKFETFSEVDEVTSALFFDYDNDGWEDLYLLSDEGSVFLENEEGDLREKEVGLEIEYNSVRSASAADYTGNGCLDVFVVQAQDWREERPVGYDDRNVTIEEDNGNENRLFAGNCESFEETTEETGIEGEAWSLATSFVDLTNNGYPDIHVANDFNNDVLYLNNGDETFERRVMPDFTNRNAMSSEVADLTGNGYLEIFVTNIHYGREVTGAKGFDGRDEGNNLLVNQGNGSFTDVSEEKNVNVGGWGWATLLADLDNDGNQDILHTVTATLDNYPALWQGNGPGYTRINSSAAGLDRSAGFGIAALDYNLDGTLDVAVSNRRTSASEPSVDGRYRLYENLNKGGFLRVSVDGNPEATDIGTVVTVSDGDEMQTRVKSSRADYMSQSSRFLHFGLGSKDELSLSVKWNDGNEETYENVERNTTVSVSPDGLEVVEAQ